MNNLEERLRCIRDFLTTGLVERDVAVRLALVAALSGEHLLLVGPPGTAKSLVARRLRLALANTGYFERLLTRFSVPEELFGPLSIKGLEEDRYERLTKSYLPTASIAFLDEIFKANSAILNALLTLLNEREFDNGDRRERTPLTAVVGASNELPEGEELDALFDRFLLRLHVVPVSSAGFSALLQLKDSTEPDVPVGLRLTEDDLAKLRKRAEDVRVPDEVLALLRDLREWCIAETILVSDRRWRKVVKLLQTSALTNGRVPCRFGTVGSCSTAFGAKHGTGRRSTGGTRRASARRPMNRRSSFASSTHWRASLRRTRKNNHSCAMMKAISCTQERWQTHFIH